MYLPKAAFLSLAVASALAACSSTSDIVELNEKPAFVAGAIVKAIYDGNSNDLLTGGLGKTGLGAATPPAFADAANPTLAELRTRAIYNNYRALVDPTANGGFGVLYGPNVTSTGSVTTSEGKIAGDEWLAYADDGAGAQSVTMMVQIPGTFDVDNPCIVAAPSSGSRGVYGAIATAGEWGLKKGCAVAYTDKGTGMGVHDLAGNTVNTIQGARKEAVGAGKESNFTASLSSAELAALNAATPNRLAFKHAHSQQNPEKDWGKNVLQAIEFAFYALNEKLGEERDGKRTRRFKPSNTLVIASSVSNGGGASLAAAEQDIAGLIDGVAVAEPNVNLPATLNVTIRRGANNVSTVGKSLLDYFTYANLYQPCAALAAANATAPGLAFVNATRATDRCAALVQASLLNGTTLADQSADAVNRLRSYGWEAETDLLHASHYAFATPAIALTYANTYARASVKDNLCGFSFGATSATTFQPVAVPAATLNGIFASGNGIPPTSGINLVNNTSVGGASLDGVSISPTSNKADLNADGANCLRALVTGPSAAQTGINEIRRTGNLRGKPAIIVHGRSDTLIPVNHSSRPYFGLNKQLEGAASRLSYIEVTNAQHFDTFIGTAALAGYDTRFVPLHVYFNRAMDAMYAHLKSSAALPPSQVIRTTPRGGTPGAAPAITAANVPALSATPQTNDVITFANNSVNVPD